MEITSGKRPKPRRCLIYGVGGIGKYTWITQAPKHVIIQTEEAELG